jgi:hypothetical protein
MLWRMFQLTVITAISNEIASGTFLQFDVIYFCDTHEAHHRVVVWLIIIRAHHLYKSLYHFIITADFATTTTSSSY